MLPRRADTPPGAPRHGADNNGDGIVNDRLPGVGLRSLRGDGQWQVNARFTYTFVLGGGVAGAAPVAARYRLNVFTIWVPFGIQNSGRELSRSPRSSTWPSKNPKLPLYMSALPFCLV